MRRAGTLRAVAVACVACLAGAALAQSDAEIAVAPEAGPAWDDATAEAFFAGPDRGTLRPEAEIRSRWEALPPEAQEEVRRDCAAIAVDARDVQGAASGGVLDADGAVVPGAEGADPAAAEAEATAEACALVDGFEASAAP